jgi:hypothetical protein
VREHNEAMEQRTEKAHEQASNEDAKNDKVPKKFWAGELTSLSHGVHVVCADC